MPNLIAQLYAHAMSYAGPQLRAGIHFNVYSIRKLLGYSKRVLLPHLNDQIASSQMHEVLMS
jgi:hypothetical protein